MSVWLLQCLCPARHCLLGVAYEDTLLGTPEAAAAAIRGVESVFNEGTLDRWCGICGSREIHYETGRMPYQTLKEAMGPLREAEAANLATRAMIERERN